jgi:hypothetical protein
LEKPVSALANAERRTSTLFFEEREPLEFYLRGGIAWPTIVDRADSSDFEGFAILGGLNLETNKIEIFEQRNFLTIDHVLEQDPHAKTTKIEYHGLGPWFNECWNKYYASTFYYHQDTELNKRYRIEVIRSKWIKQPKPNFVEVPWLDDDEAQMTVWRYVRFNNLVIEKDSQLAKELVMVKPGEKEMKPSVHSLQCLLTALDRFPPRFPK